MDGDLHCVYDVDGVEFAERFSFAPSDAWGTPAADAAATVLFLAAGVSYYKTGAPPVVDLGTTPAGPATRRWLREYYVDGLGEFAYRNGLHLTGIEIVGGADPGPAAGYAGDARRPLVPFGGGIDSIVTVELTRGTHPDASLFVVNRPGDRFDAIERPAEVTGLPIARAERSIDAKVLESAARGYLNGHVPVTGIISAAAVLAAVLDGRGAVVMSNEWSSSSGTIVVDGRDVNHQWSKSLAFEESFRAALAESLGSGFEYFSRLRPHTELWIARRFAGLTRYHDAFRSCNRAFSIDPARRLDRWCGRCDKCCFIDLILAPYVPAERLEAIFGGEEPLRRPDLLESFRGLVGIGDGVKPFECVGDVDESRAAVLLAADRDDRRDDALVAKLAAEVRAEAPAVDVERLLRPMGHHFVPDAYAVDA